MSDEPDYDPIVDVSTYADGGNQRWSRPMSYKLTYEEANALGLTEPPVNAEDEARLRAELMSSLADTDGGKALEAKILPLLNARMAELESGQP